MQILTSDLVVTTEKQEIAEMKLDELDTLYLFADKQAKEESRDNERMKAERLELETMIKRKDFIIKDNANVKSLLDRAEKKIKDLKKNVVTRDKDT